MKLTFPADIVAKLIEHSAKSPKHSPTYSQKETAKPGLWLVGDDGVYLMSNGTPAMANDGSLITEEPKFPTKPIKRLVAYANECNPEEMDFDDWWAAKRASFGGDDGVEFIPLTDIPKSGEIVIEINSKEMRIL